MGSAKIRQTAAEHGKGQHAGKGLSGLLPLPLAYLSDDDGVAAGADHDAHGDEETDDRVVEVHGADGQIAHIALNEQPVHHLVDADKHKGKDAGGNELQQRPGGKCL